MFGLKKMDKRNIDGRKRVVRTSNSLLRTVARKGDDEKIKEVIAENEDYISYALDETYEDGYDSGKIAGMYKGAAIIVGGLFVGSLLGQKCNSKNKNNSNAKEGEDL